MSENNSVNQTGAFVEGDLTGRDKITVYRYRRSKLETLVEALRTEKPQAGKAPAANETLQYYSEPVSDDGIVGLEAKLEIAGRQSQIGRAIRQKEEFRKILELWAHSETAQIIFADLLARVEQKFNSSIYVLRETLSQADFDTMVHKEIVEPLNEQIGANPLGLSELTITGMLFWLAEKCHIKWH